MSSYGSSVWIATPTTAPAVVSLLHIALSLTAFLLAARLGGEVAAAWRQPRVVGEIAVGLLVGWIVASPTGAPFRAAVYTPATEQALHWTGRAGLTLFLVAVAHDVRSRRAPGTPRTVGGVVAGAVVPSVVVGALLGAAVSRTDRQLAGSSPAWALVVFCAVALAVTAVPVLARILVARGEEGRLTGVTALWAAVVVDALAWVVLVAVVALSRDRPVEAGPALAILIAVTAAAVAANGVGSWSSIRGVAERHPTRAAMLLASTAFLAASATDRVGLTMVPGAVLAGLAIPAGRGTSHWDRPLREINRGGLALVPFFFVSAATKAFADPLSMPSWTVVILIALVTSLVKVLGTGVGARCVGFAGIDALRLGVLMNTRGLTEIAVLQVWLESGLLTPALFLAMLIMTLVATALTSPALSAIDRWSDRTAKSDTPPPPVPQEVAQQLMAGFPSGVLVVAAVDGAGSPAGMTCSSLCSVTLNPPTLLLCLRGRSPTLDAVVHRGTFAVNFLHIDARGTARQFASGDAGRWHSNTWHLPDGAGGPHLGEAAQAVADCRVTGTTPVGDHTVVMGEVVGVTDYREPRPLIYGLRRYADWPA